MLRYKSKFKIKDYRFELMPFVSEKYTPVIVPHCFLAVQTGQDIYNAEIFNYDYSIFRNDLSVPHLFQYEKSKYLVIKKWWQLRSYHALASNSWFLLIIDHPTQILFGLTGLILI